MPRSSGPRSREAAAARRSDAGDDVRRLEEELAIARAPIEVPPLPRRSGEPEPRRYGTGTRIAAVVLVALCWRPSC